MIIARTVLMAVACLLFTAPIRAQDVSRSGQLQDSQERQILRLKLEKMILSESSKIREELNTEVEANLTSHRRYLQELDDRFYSRLRIWVPIATAVAGVLFAIFLWLVGKTQREAFEGAQLVAVAKATELARQKVHEIIVPENVRSKAESMAAAALENAEKIIEGLLTDLREELTVARNQVVRDKHAVIMETLNEALEQGFGDELNMIERIERVERQVSNQRRVLNTIVDILERKPYQEVALTLGKSSVLRQLVPFLDIGVQMWDQRGRRKLGSLVAEMNSLAEPRKSEDSG